MGYLNPVHIQEVLPGDKYHMGTESLIRLMPTIAPIMHKVDITYHHFFVPNRILWKNWEDFITGGADGKAAPAPPLLEWADGVLPSTLDNYLGCPVTNNTTVFSVNALAWAAYDRIWFDYYRDQNLEDVEVIQLSDGVQDALTTTRLRTLRKRAWQHDYFTSMLPYAQKGDPVTIPIDFSDASIQAVQPPGFNPLFRKTSDGTQLGSGTPGYVQYNSFGSLTSQDGSQPGYYDPQGSLVVDGQVQTTLEDLRRASRLQEWLEKNMRAGSRYFESLLSHFGVKSPDARLQRAEYLGGSKSSMAISEVLQTSSSDSTSPQGNMAGHGINVTAGKDFSFNVPEHGHIITILNVQPKTAYYNGLPRFLSKQDRLDYAWPEFAQLGEQPVLTKELSYRGPTAPGNPDDAILGYLPIYTDYRFNSSRVSGQMATSLEYWHLARKFDQADPRPVLNPSFIQCTPSKRIFAVENPNDDELVAHILHKITAQRPLPKYGTPTFG